MTRALLLTCNSRSGTISLHGYDHNRGEAIHLRDVGLPVPPGESSASPMALSMDSTKVYLAWRGAEKRLLTFTLNRQSAALDLVASQAIEGNICFLHATPDGRRLLGAGGEHAYAFPLSSEGVPSPAAAPLWVGEMAHCVVSGQDNRIFATACRGDLIRSITDHAVREFEDIPQPKGSGPRHLCLSPSDRHLYCVTQESGEVVVFDTTGELREAQRLKMVEDIEAPMGGDIGITPDGRFLYATERSTNRVIAYRVDRQSGFLTPLAWKSAPDYPRSLCIGGNGEFVAVAGFRGHRAAIFAIGDDGRLEPRVEFSTGERPSWILSVDAA